jgi:hypothetical protein
MITEFDQLIPLLVRAKVEFIIVGSAAATVVNPLLEPSPIRR